MLPFPWSVCSEAPDSPKAMRQSRPGTAREEAELTLRILFSMKDCWETLHWPECAGETAADFLQI